MKTSELIKESVRGLFSRKARNRLRDYFRCHRLFMTLLIKDEEEIIEQNIRFHAAMGVDGFIVTLHCSTDRSKEILEKLQKEGFLIEIIEISDPAFKLDQYADNMICMARDRYRADWVISADSDEFYYASCLDLKQAIRDAQFGNVLLLESIFGMPDDGTDCFEDTWFIARPLPAHERGLLAKCGIPEHNMFYLHPGGLYRRCPKVIFRTRGYQMIDKGNHGVSMRAEQVVRCADVRLYHYSMRNYNGLVRKVLRHQESVKTMSDGVGDQQKRLWKLYEQGCLRKEFDTYFSPLIREKLVELGVVVKDPSVLNFLKYKGIHL